MDKAVPIHILSAFLSGIPAYDLVRTVDTPSLFYIGEGVLFIFLLLESLTYPQKGIHQRQWYE